MFRCPKIQFYMMLGRQTNVTVISSGRHDPSRDLTSSLKPCVLKGQMGAFYFLTTGSSTFHVLSWSIFFHMCVRVLTSALEINAYKHSHPYRYQDCARVHLSCEGFKQCKNWECILIRSIWVQTWCHKLNLFLCVIRSGYWQFEKQYLLSSFRQSLEKKNGTTVIPTQS